MLKESFHTPMHYKNRILRPLIFLLASSCLSTAAIAGISPFKKNKTLEFGPEIQWHLDKLSVKKTGTFVQRNDRYYYHLSINDQQLLLQLSKNDAGTGNNSAGNNSLALENLEVLDVLIDSQRLPLFQWCLDNRTSDTSYKVLNKDSRVKNDICAIDINTGKIVLNLNEESRSQITQSKTLSIDIKPGKYISHLQYDMKGFKQKLKEFNLSKVKPVKPPVSVQKKPPVKSTPVKKNPVKKPPVVAVRKKVSLCYAKAPDKFSKKIDPISYPCSNKSLKKHARKAIDDKVAQQKRAKKQEERRIKEEEEQRLATIERQRLEKISKKNAQETTQRETEWKEKKASLWVGRCMRHWKKGVSPCYCRPYLASAPAGTQDTCKKKDYTQLTQE